MHRGGVSTAHLVAPPPRQQIAILLQFMLRYWEYCAPRVRNLKEGACKRQGEAAMMRGRFRFDWMVTLLCVLCSDALAQVVTEFGTGINATHRVSHPIGWRRLRQQKVVDRCGNTAGVEQSQEPPTRRPYRQPWPSRSRTSASGGGVPVMNLQLQKPRIFPLL